MSLEDLKPCHFCGGESWLSTHEEWNDCEGYFDESFYIHCTKCLRDSDIFNTDKEAIESWNKN